ncbi:hypothetical protein COOONC_01364 [Cooperia oncophora]
MLLLLVIATFAASSTGHNYDLTVFPEQSRELGHRESRLLAERSIGMLDPVTEEAVQQPDAVLDEHEEPVVHKRKNEFIRFGKRGARFGRSDSTANEPHAAKRKNEFIRFG